MFMFMVMGEEELGTAANNPNFKREARPAPYNVSHPGRLPPKRTSEKSPLKEPFGLRGPVPGGGSGLL